MAFFMLYDSENETTFGIISVKTSIKFFICNTTLCSKLHSQRFTFQFRYLRGKIIHLLKKKRRKEKEIVRLWNSN